MTLSEMKTSLIKKVKRHYTNHIINPVYPDYKQRNITLQLSGYVAQDKTDMIAFLDGKRADIDVIEADIDALTLTDLVDSYTLGQADAALITYVAGYLTTLTTDEQKLAVGDALQLCVLLD